jgi:hypothetical protein
MVEEEWTPQLWKQRLMDVQLTTGVLVGNLKGALEHWLRIGNAPWIETYKCLSELDWLRNVVKRAHPARKWEAQPVTLIRDLTQRIQDFQEPMLESYLLQLALLENDFEILLDHSLQ